MVVKIDSMLFRYAGWLIRVAAFFGINRWQLIVIWILVSGIILLLLYASAPLLIVLGMPVACGLYSETKKDGDLERARKSYREDDTLSEDMPQTAFLRVVIVFLWIIVTLFISGFLTWLAVSVGFVQGNTPAIVIAIALLKITLPHEYWYYFCLHQSPKDPVTLRQLAKSLAAKVRKALSPTPQPRLAPQPVSACAPLP